MASQAEVVVSSKNNVLQSIRLALSQNITRAKIAEAASQQAANAQQVIFNTLGTKGIAIQKAWIVTSGILSKGLSFIGGVLGGIVKTIGAFIAGISAAVVAATALAGAVIAVGIGYAKADDYIEESGRKLNDYVNKTAETNTRFKELSSTLNNDFGTTIVETDNSITRLTKNIATVGEQVSLVFKEQVAVEAYKGMWGDLGRQIAETTPILREVDGVIQQVLTSMQDSDVAADNIKNVFEIFTLQSESFGVAPCISRKFIPT